jgi:hypothetical protein
MVIATAPTEYVIKGEVEILNKPLTLEDLISMPLEQAQVAINREIEYIKSAEKFVYQSNSGYNSIPAILNKKAGNCKDGFSLMAGICAGKGYKVYGLSVNPTDPESDGHIVCVYQDQKTGKFGTAGIGNGDFMPPAYETLEQIATNFTIKNNWNKADAYVLEPTKEQLNQLISGTEPVEIPHKELCTVNIKDKFGVEFQKAEGKNGKIKYTMTPYGCAVTFAGLLVPQKKIDGLGEVITDIRMSIFGDGRIYYDIESDSPAGSYDTSFTIEKDGTKHLNIFYHPVDLSGVKRADCAKYPKYGNKWELSEETNFEVKNIDEAGAQYGKLLTALFAMLMPPQYQMPALPRIKKTKKIK